MIFRQNAWIIKLWQSFLTSQSLFTAHNKQVRYRQTDAPLEKEESLPVCEAADLGLDVCCHCYFSGAITKSHPTS